MIGAILGDIVGSIYEFDNIKTKEFELFDKECFFTDDSVMTFAVAEVFLDDDLLMNDEVIRQRLIESMQRYGKLYPRAGYGGMFRH